MKQLIIFFLILIPVISFSQTGGTDMFLTKTDSLNLPQLKQVTPDSTKVLTVDINGGVGYTYNEGSAVTPDSTWNEATVIDTFYLKDTTAKIYKDVASGELTFKDSVSGAQKLSELVGGGYDILTSLGYQEGCWFPNLSSTTAMNTSGLFSSVTSADATSARESDDIGGVSFVQWTSTSKGNTALTFSSVQEFYAKSKPKFIIKIKSRNVELTHQSIYLGLTSSSSNELYSTSRYMIGLKYYPGDSYYYFVTGNSSGNITLTSTGVSLSNQVIIFVADVVSTSQVNFYLYDQDMTLLSSAVHTTNIPTSAMYFKSGIVNNSTSGGTAAIHQYFGKIIIR